MRFLLEESIKLILGLEESLLVITRGLWIIMDIDTLLNEQHAQPSEVGLWSLVILSHILQVLLDKGEVLQLVSGCCLATHETTLCL